MTAPAVGLPDHVTVRANRHGTFTVSVYAPDYVGETVDGGYSVIHGMVRQGSAPTYHAAWELADRWAGETGGRLFGEIVDGSLGWESRRIAGATVRGTFI